MIGNLTYLQFFAAVGVGVVSARLVTSTTPWVRKVGVAVIALYLVLVLMFVSYLVGYDRSPWVQLDAQEKVCL